MFKKAFMFIFIYIIAVFLVPVFQSYDFKTGLNAEYAKSWLETNVYPDYDRSIIHQVNSTQTQEVEIKLDEHYEVGNKEVLDSEYAGDFVVEDEPGLFRLVLVQDGKVVGGYTNSDDVSIADINIENLDRQKVGEVYGESEDFIVKGWKRLRVNDKEFEVFDLQDSYVYFFYDLHEEDKVNGLFVMDKEQISSIDTLYNNPPARDNSRLNHLIVNASRIEYGLEPLEYDEKTAETARGHSRDMAENDYFAHDSPDGGTLKDRIESNDVEYRMAGENIATGHTSALFAHHSLLNSPDHRVNVLNPEFTHLGTGTAYGKKEVPYYTENYIKR